jgi:hypothetical protein
MAKQHKSNPDVRPFVGRGEQLGYVGPLKERGLWPPRLHNKKDQNHGNDRPVTTPYLVVLNSPADVALRPLTQAKAFHSQGVWIEDMGGAMVNTPVVGGKYRIKCRVKNFGAFPAYAGLIDFYLNKPGVFTAAAGTTTVLPTFGHAGFTALQGQTITAICPTIWQPATNADLQSGILVQAYDPITDGIISRYDAIQDRHVGRLDFTSDFYVRDWTDSATIHDLGQEPSSHPVFYRTSDIWNRRVSDPGLFVNDRPAHQNPQAGDGAAGDNVVFARISRNTADTQEAVRAHFMVAEFGTGSPFTNCSPAPDPSVTFLPGEKTKLVSLPWHLHPTASPHLCMAVQIYSDADPFVAPSLVGNTPGWPTTDQMVTNDNNKAQRNMHVWDHIPETEGTAWAMIFNASLFRRDVSLQIMTSDEDTRRVRNPVILLADTAIRQSFLPGAMITLKGMLPGERRYVGFSYDALQLKEGQSITVLFSEMVGKTVVNGYSLELQGATPAVVMQSVLERQQAIFFRLQSGFGIATASKGTDLVRQLLDARPSVKAYIQRLPTILAILTDSLNELSNKQGGVKDVFSIAETTRKLGFLATEQSVSNALALHLKLLNSVDAWQTTVSKNQGDEADIPFTLRLQQRIYTTEKVRSGGQFDKLVQLTESFMANYTAGKATPEDYQIFIRTQLDAFKLTVERVGARILKIALDELVKSINKSPSLVQKAHLNFLNTVLAGL